MQLPMPDSQLKSHTCGNLSPSDWVMRWSRLLAPGVRVLDFASGGGRNLPPLIARGARITASDRDAAALASLAQFAPQVRCIQTDLENASWPFEAASFDAVVCCNFLHRPRLDLLCALLAPGGVLIYETFARGNEHYGKPSNPAFLLASGELFTIANRCGLSVLAYEHGFAGAGKKAMVQRVCAVRPPFDAEHYALVG